MRMMAVLVIVMLVGKPAAAGERELVRVDWSGFTREVEQRRLMGREVRIGLATGDTAKTRLVSIGENGLVVRATRAAKKRWHAAHGEVVVPKDEVARVGFEGRRGRHGLIGMLVGMGVGAGTGALLATSVDCNEGPCIIVLPVVGAVAFAIGGIAGVFYRESDGAAAAGV